MAINQSLHSTAALRESFVMLRTTCSPPTHPATQKNMQM